MSINVFKSYSSVDLQILYKRESFSAGEVKHAEVKNLTQLMRFLLFSPRY